MSMIYELGVGFSKCIAVDWDLAYGMALVLSWLAGVLGQRSPYFIRCTIDSQPPFMLLTCAKAMYSMHSLCTTSKSQNETMH
jgi:hypothetical protein